MHQECQIDHEKEVFKLNQFQKNHENKRSEESDYLKQGPIFVNFNFYVNMIE